MTNQKIKKAIAMSAEGYPLLGQVLYWAIPAQTVPYLQFVQLLKKHGINPDIIKAPRAKSALNRAVRDTAKGSKGTFHRKALDEKDRTAFVIVNSEVDSESADVEFETETKVMFDKEHQSVSIEGARKEDIKARYEQYREQYTQEQIRTFVLRYIRMTCEASNLRDQGGVYFIPATKLEDFNKLKACVEELPGVSLDQIPVIDTPAAKKSLWKSFVGDVEAELQQFAKDLEDNQDDEMSSRSFQMRLNRFQKLQEKIGNYEDLLTGTAVDLKSKLSGLTEQLRKLAGVG
jgi:hypothetical protein